MHISISVLEPRKFDAEFSAVPVKRLNLSIASRNRTFFAISKNFTRDSTFN